MTFLLMDRVDRRNGTRQGFRGANRLLQFEPEGNHVELGESRCAAAQGTGRSTKKSRTTGPGAGSAWQP